jgi:hypothetical protein
MAETMSVGVSRAPASGSGAVLRAVALPVEHGGWGLLAEPLLLGLLAAPSVAGAALGVAALFGFLWRHPMRIVLGDRRRGVRYPRTRAAAGVAATYALIALGAGVVGLRLSATPLYGLLLAAAPLAAVYLAFDLRMRSRELVAELAGAFALSSGGALVAAAAGWSMPRTLGVWLLLAGRQAASILEIRCRLRRQRGVPTSDRPALFAHGGACVFAAMAAAAGSIPVLALSVPLTLLARGLWNLRDGAAAQRPQQVGWSEVRAGALATFAWAIVYRSAS